MPPLFRWKGTLKPNLSIYIQQHDKVDGDRCLGIWLGMAPCPGDVMVSAFQSTKKSDHKKWCIVRLCDHSAVAEVHSLHRF